MKLLHIKNMVCPRCIMTIEKTLEEMGFDLNDVDLGIVEFHEPISLEERTKIENAIKPLGFEILEEKKAILVERVKNAIIELINKEVNDLTITLSEYLQSKLQTEYNTLNELFCLQESHSIDQYFVLQKIEKVKELLVYEDLNLNEIAYKMNYNTPANLSNQFKKITGLSPNHFKSIKANKENISKNK